MFLTATEAARYLSVSPPTFRRIVQRGRIPFYLLDGGTKRYRSQDLNRYMRMQKVYGGGVEDDGQTTVGKSV